MIASADSHVNVFAALLAHPRGVSMFAAVLGVVEARLESVVAVAAWMHRSVREVRRLLIGAQRAGVLSAPVCAQIDRLIGADQGDKSPDTTGEKSPQGDKSPDTSGDKSPLRASARAGSLSGTENRVEQSLESHAQEPPLRRPSIVRGIMRRAGLRVEWSAKQMAQLEHRLNGWSDELCAELAQRYVADTSASGRARDHLALFWSLLPVYLMHHKQGAQIGTPSRAEVAAADARLRTELRVGGRPVQPEAKPEAQPEARPEARPSVQRAVVSQELEHAAGGSTLGLVRCLQREAQRVMGAHYVAQDFAHVTGATLDGDALIVTMSDELAALLAAKRADLYQPLLARVTGAAVSYRVEYQPAA